MTLLFISTIFNSCGNKEDETPNCILECINDGQLDTEDCQCDCPCGFYGTNCEKSMKVEFSNIRETRRGSNVQPEAWVQGNSKEVLVGIAIGVYDSNVEVIEGTFRSINPDGTMGNSRRVIAGNNPNRARLERSYVVPGNAIITGVWTEVYDNNVNSLIVEYRSIYRDENNCTLKLGDKKVQVIGASGIEIGYSLEEEYDNSDTPCILGIGFECYDSNMRTILVKTGEIKLVK